MILLLYVAVIAYVFITILGADVVGEKRVKVVRPRREFPEPTGAPVTHSESAEMKVTQ